MEQVRDEPTATGDADARWRRVTDLDISYRSPSGTGYAVTVEGLPRDDGTWAGRLRFVSGGDIRVTEQETSQPSRDALVYWASGLEAIYLDGAFDRAR